MTGDFKDWWHHDIKLHHVELPKTHDELQELLWKAWVHGVRNYFNLQVQHLRKQITPTPEEMI